MGRRSTKQQHNIIQEKNDIIDNIIDNINEKTNKKTLKTSELSNIESNLYINDEKMKIIDIILNMYPELKNDKKDIINAVFCKINKPQKYIFTKILFNNEELYVDSDGLLMTRDLVFRGFVRNNKFYMTEEEDEQHDLNDIKELDKLMNFSENS